jgi:hypothetical protein
MNETQFRAHWTRKYKLTYGFDLPKKLTILGTSIKVAKGEKKGVLTAVVYLAPSTLSVLWNMCPHASEGCSAACLGHSSGRLVMDSSRRAQLWKTAMFMDARDLYIQILGNDIARHERKARKLSMICAVRLNGSSDLFPLAYERLMDTFRDVRFYDYTKDQIRYNIFLDDDLPPNYHLTFSVDERPETHDAAVQFVAAGGTAAVVFKGTLPAKHRGVQVLDGDESDVRFFDTPGRYVGLTAKGAAKGDTSGFAV